MDARTIVSGALIFITAVLLAAVLTGCTWHGQGTVIHKDHQPRRTMLIGKVISTKAECWRLIIRDDNLNRDPHDSGEHETCVPKDRWEHTAIGQSITITKEP